MTDPMERLEAELASLCPSPLSANVVVAIADELAEPPPPPLRLTDRCLLAVMGAGSVAACVIVGLIVWQVAGPTSQSPASPQQILAVQTPPAPPPPPATLGQYQQALVRSSDVVPEILR